MASPARRASTIAGTSPLGEQVEAGAAQEVGPSHQLVRQRGHEPAPVPLEPGQQAAHGPAADLDAEVGGRDVLEMVRLVEHQPRYGGSTAASSQLSWA